MSLTMKKYDACYQELTQTGFSRTQLQRVMKSSGCPYLENLTNTEPITSTSDRVTNPNDKEFNHE